MNEEPITHRTMDILVVDGRATLPDGSIVETSAKVVRVPYLLPEDAERLQMLRGTETSETAEFKVRMPPELVEQWLTRDAAGYLLTWSWGEPDADGFYTPTVTTHADDRLGELDAAWAAAIAAIPVDEDGIEEGELALERCGCGGAYAVLSGIGPLNQQFAAPDIREHGDDEVAALRALTVKLRERAG